MVSEFAGWGEHLLGGRVEDIRDTHPLIPSEEGNGTNRGMKLRIDRCIGLR